MLDFVKKNEYWECENFGLLDLMPNKHTWHLKTIQDAIALKHLKDLNDKRIIEIGGADSRVLEVIKNNNTCFNVDEWKGAGNGPTKETNIDGVGNIYVNIGEYSSQLEAQNFDVAFSISVVEHVPISSLQDFFDDMLRVLKPGGIFLHLIDVYIEDNKTNNNELIERIKIYRDVLDRDDVKPFGESIVPSDIKFSCSYATNPDNVLNAWNKMVPVLTGKREVSQSCTLLMMGSKLT